MYKITTPIVQFGDHWQLNGLHEFHSNDMLHVDISPVDLVYTDPPWNPSIMKWFYNHSVPRPIEEFSNFLSNRIEKIKTACPTGYIFIEFGLKTFPLLVERFMLSDAKLLAEANCTYTNKKIQMKVACFTFDKQRLPIEIPPDMHEWEICETLLTQYSKPNQRMLEPFCGEGYQSRIAMKNKLVITGIELIPDKLTSLIKKTKGDWKCLNRKIK